jgi:hypothetical protein
MNTSNFAKVSSQFPTKSYLLLLYSMQIAMLLTYWTFASGSQLRAFVENRNQYKKSNVCTWTKIRWPLIARPKICTLDFQTQNLHPLQKVKFQIAINTKNRFVCMWHNFTSKYDYNSWSINCSKLQIFKIKILHHVCQHLKIVYLCS